MFIEKLKLALLNAGYAESGIVLVDTETEGKSNLAISLGGEHPSMFVDVLHEDANEVGNWFTVASEFRPTDDATVIEKQSFKVCDGVNEVTAIEFLVLQLEYWQ